MKTKILLSTGIFALVAAAQSVTIDFELGGPGVFSAANPLREEYAGLGAHFSGPGPLDGGAVLNHISFWIGARSGTDFLAFNEGATMQNGGNPTGPERIDFDADLESISIWFAGFVQGDVGELRAYDATDTQIGFHSVAVTNIFSYEPLFISGVGDIAYVTLDSSGSVFVLDDLTFEPVPEPATFIAIGIGLAGLAVARRRK